MEGKVRIGIIGVGTIGNVHLDALKNTPAARVAALCDIKADRLREVAGKHNVQATFADYRKMLKEADLDAIYVCVPNYLHSRLAIAGFEAGKHVFCEKPMAMSAAQGRAMLAAAKGAGKVFAMGMTWRHMGESRAVKKFIDAGQVGRIYHIRVNLIRRRGIPGLGGWFTTKAMAGGGGLIDCGVHFLDLAMWLTDSWKPERVSAATYSEFGTRMENYVYTGMWAGPPDFNGVFDVDDYAVGFVRFPNNVTMDFQVSWALNAEGGNSIEIMGDKGGVRCAGGKPPVFFSESNGHIVDVTPQYGDRNPFESEAANFMGAILGKEKPFATGEQAVIVMRLLDAIYKSAKLGREIPVA